ncbi:MAG: ATP-dependent Clp protease ATP-binding subunit [bacterium]
MNIIERFSTHLREAMTRSITMATELNQPLVQPIHLLFTLCTLKGSVASEIASRLQINDEIIEQMIIKLPSETKKMPGRKKRQIAQAELSSLSPSAKQALEKSIMYAHQRQHNYVGTEHLLLALIDLKDKLIGQVLSMSGINPDEIKNQLDTVLNNATQFPQVAELSETMNRMQESLGDPVMNTPSMTMDNSKSKSQQSALDFFATNLTDPEIQKNIDPVIGRKDEIERLTQILCRRTKNNPVLLGDPGVGKTAIVEGLAKKINEGKVPGILLNKKIYALDMGMLIAGTTFRGEFESRLQHIIEDIAKNPNIILFIDEIHNIVGAGSNQGTMDASNILKPVLARGHIRCIGATTPTEFKKYIENDSALERRFQPIYVKQSSVEDTIKILKGIKINYEKYHNVKITDKAVKAAAYLADRYITDKLLPDKAIDLLDETAASKKMAGKITPQQSNLLKLEQELEKTTVAKEKATFDDNFQQAVKLKAQEHKLAKQIQQLQNQNAKKQLTKKPIGSITNKDVLKQLSKVINTPVDELILDKKEKLKNLETELKKSIIGQDRTITQVSQTIRQAQLQISNPERPMASFMFVGESGMGKTELAKTLSQVLYPSQDALIALNMSEFNESHSVSKLLGSPAGYIGYKESNQFTDKIKMNPYCVILLDEIDKAHADVTKLLLQILENGEITDSTGRKISLKHAIIILTTTAGAQQAKKGGIGFGDTKNHQAEIEKKVIEHLKEYFSIEMINRVDKICLLNTLQTQELAKIAQLEIKMFNDQLKKYKTKIHAEDQTIEWLIKQISQSDLDARTVRGHVRQEVERLMSDLLLNEKVKPKYHLEAIGNQLLIK